MLSNSIKYKGNVDNKNSVKIQLELRDDNVKEGAEEEWEYESQDIYKKSLDGAKKDASIKDNADAPYDTIRYAAKSEVVITDIPHHKGNDRKGKIKQNEPISKTRNDKKKNIVVKIESDKRISPAYQTSMTSNISDPLKDPIFKLGRVIGSGAFGQLRLCTDVSTEKVYAVKLENVDAKQPQLHKEYHVYWILHRDSELPDLFSISTNEKESDKSENIGKNMPSNRNLANHKKKHSKFYNPGTNLPMGFVQIYYYGECTNRFNALVMDLLGPSLQELFVMVQKTFSLKTILMIAMQTLDRIEFLHRKGIVYRDVKPQNFLIGRKSLGLDGIIYLIDFGLSKEYLTSDGEHIPHKMKKSLTGTARYMSINTHEGYEQSRRDDIESLAYLYIYFLKGSLPWQNLDPKKAFSNKERYKMIGLKKRNSLGTEDLCDGVPAQFQDFLNYSRGISFEEEPDYTYLRGLLIELFMEQNLTNDGLFDWNGRKYSNENSSKILIDLAEVGGEGIKVDHQVGFLADNTNLTKKESRPVKMSDADMDRLNAKWKIVSQNAEIKKEGKKPDVAHSSNKLRTSKEMRGEADLEEQRQKIEKKIILKKYKDEEYPVDFVARNFDLEKNEGVA
ncbi:unnamed protein product [Gordionus sp. m RMFG-2023]